MKLLFVVEQTFFLEGVGLVLAPGLPVGPELAFGTPLFLVRPDGTHITTVVRPMITKAPTAPTRPIAVDLLDGDAPEGTRVFGRDPNSSP